MLWKTVFGKTIKKIKIHCLYSKMCCISIRWQIKSLWESKLTQYCKTEQAWHHQILYSSLNHTYIFLIPAEIWLLPHIYHSPAKSGHGNSMPDGRGQNHYQHPWALPAPIPSSCSHGSCSSLKLPFLTNSSQLGNPSHSSIHRAINAVQHEHCEPEPWTLSMKGAVSALAKSNRAVWPEALLHRPFQALICSSVQHQAQAQKENEPQASLQS